MLFYVVRYFVIFNWGRVGIISHYLIGVAMALILMFFEIHVTICYDSRAMFCSLLSGSSRETIISSFLGFDLRPLGGHFVTDLIVAFVCLCGARARVDLGPEFKYVLLHVCDAFATLT